jgi:hypothetical protein
MAAMHYDRFLSFFHQRISIKYKYETISKILIGISSQNCIGTILWKFYFKIQDIRHA